MQKKDIFLKKIVKIFAYIKKKQYLCTRFREKSTSLVRLSSCTTSCTRSVSLAQLVEQLTLNQWVESSSLSGDTKGHPNGCPFSLLEAFCEVLGFVNLVNFANIHHAVVSWNVGL